MTAVAVTAEERAEIVSQLAKGFPVQDVASRAHVAVVVVEALKAEYGPGLGELATAAARLRTGLKPAEDTADSLLERAAAVPRIAKQVDKVRALLDEMKAGIVAAEKAAHLERIVAQRAAELEKAKKALAEARGVKPTLAGDAAKVRAWALANGLVVPARGVIPTSVRDAYKAAQK